VHYVLVHYVVVHYVVVHYVVVQYQRFRRRFAEVVFGWRFPWWP
jgi:hypothetical protein